MVVVVVVVVVVVGVDVASSVVVVLVVSEVSVRVVGSSGRQVVVLEGDEASLPGDFSGKSW